MTVDKDKSNDGRIDARVIRNRAGEISVFFLDVKPAVINASRENIANYTSGIILEVFYYFFLIPSRFLSLSLCLLSRARLTQKLGSLDVKS